MYMGVLVMGDIDLMMFKSAMLVILSKLIKKSSMNMVVDVVS